MFTIKSYIVFRKSSLFDSNFTFKFNNVSKNCCKALIVSLLSTDSMDGIWFSGCGSLLAATRHF